MTSLLREDTPVPMPEVASATTTSCPASAAARATASPTTPAPTTRTCIRPAPLTRERHTARRRPRESGDDSIRTDASDSASQFDRQAGVVLGHRTHGGLRARHIVELGELALAVEGIVARIEMKQLRHPPGEALRLPHPPQAGRGIAFEQFAAAGAIELGKSAGEHQHIGQSEVHA